MYTRTMTRTVINHNRISTFKARDFYLSVSSLVLNLATPASSLNREGSSCGGSLFLRRF
jgi:hypothetical protein